MKTFSFGGGVQSVAVLVLQAQGRVNYDYFLFSNVGEDSENPAALKYFREYALPFAEQHGIKLIELRKTNRKGEITETLYQRQMRETKSILIPAWLESGAFGNRWCTRQYKMLVIQKWLRQHGASKANPATVGIGFSMDEWHRAKDSRDAIQINEYPLLELRLSRNDCRKIIQDAGLPIPPKSSCYFCPFHRQTEWQRLKREELELFAKAVEIDSHIREKRGELGKDGMYLHFARIPLDKAVGHQLAFDFDDQDGIPCDAGVCFV